VLRDLCHGPEEDESEVPAAARRFLCRIGCSGCEDGWLGGEELAQESREVCRRHRTRGVVKVYSWVQLDV
jgi:hypothetical protein